MTTEQLFQPFNLGLGLGLIFAGFAFWRVVRLKMELNRFKRHLSDRIELEAESVRRARAETDQLRKENEQMRIRIASLSESPDFRAQKDLEVYVRAEKRMLINVPGFAAAWENAKAAAHSELQEEDAGRSLPKRVFNRFFGGNTARESLPPASGSQSGQPES
jgi:hypothetical protein